MCLTPFSGSISNAQRQQVNSMTQSHSRRSSEISLPITNLSPKEQELRLQLLRESRRSSDSNHLIQKTSNSTRRYKSSLTNSKSTLQLNNQLISMRKTKMSTLASTLKSRIQSFFMVKRTSMLSKTL